MKEATQSNIAKLYEELCDEVRKCQKNHTASLTDKIENMEKEVENEEKFFEQEKKHIQDQMEDLISQKTRLSEQTEETCKERNIKE